MRKFMLVLSCSVMLVLQSTSAMPQGQSAALTGRSTLNEIIKHGGRIESKYDGFNHETVMRLRKMKVTCDGFKDNFKDGCVSIDVTLHCPGTQINYVRNVTLQLVFENKDWVHLHPWDQRELSIVTDTETLRFGRMTHPSKDNTGTWDTKVETLEATLPYDAFKKVALSPSVEIQVGRSTVELKEKNRAALRDLNSRVVPAPQ
jgi:hypothetical protein